MSRAAVMAPPMSQEAADILVRTFSPAPGAQLISIVVDERRRRIDMEFRYKGMIAKASAVLERRPTN